MVGAPQGSVLKPPLWKVECNEVLVFPVSNATTIIGFAYNLVVVFVAKQPEEVKVYLDENKVNFKGRLYLRECIPPYQYG